MKPVPLPKNLWALCVLCLLKERPMHPYEMQRLIRQRHKHEFLKLKRGSLYHAINRLVAAGLIHEVETTREGNRPERTVYRITAAGETELEESLRHLLSTPTLDSVPFVAALSFIGHLSPEDACTQLELRAGELSCGIVALKAVIAELVPKIGRLPMIEAEHMLAMKEAELKWVQSVVTELRTQKLKWDTEQLLKWSCDHHAAEKGTPSELPSTIRSDGESR